MSDKTKGLAETAKSLLNECKGVLSLAERELRAELGNTNVAVLKAKMDELETALEAAPAGRAPTLGFKEVILALERTDEIGAVAPLCNCNNPLCDIRIRKASRVASVLNRALATPSPQAPPECDYCEALWELDVKTMKHRHPSVAGYGAFFYDCKAAATQEHVCEGNAPQLLAESPSNFALTVGNVTGVLFNAGVGLTAPVAAKVTAELNAIGGSPRKVGEDAPGDILWQRCLSLVERCREKTPDKWDFAHELAELCKEYTALARPSSVPVGEQKQEEGV